MVAVAPRGATAQVGATTDIITGTVTGPDSQPLAGAMVQAFSLETQISRQRTTDARDVQRAGDRPDPGILFARMRPRLQAGRDNIRKALERARAVLTPEQWKRLPDALKSPGFGGRARGGGRGEP